MPVRHQFKCSAIKIEAAEEIGQALAIVLIPDNGPLREKIGGVGISGVVRHGPWKKLVMTVECDGPPGDDGSRDL